MRMPWPTTDPAEDIHSRLRDRGENPRAGHADAAAGGGEGGAAGDTDL